MIGGIAHGAGGPLGRTVAAAILALAGLAAPAGASTLSQSGSALVYNAGSLEVNDLTVSRQGASYVFAEGGGVTVDDLCGTPISGPSGACAAAGITEIDIFLQDAGDTVTIDNSIAASGQPAILAEGGSGDDTLNGGNGPEALCGGADDDTLNGGGGNDRLDFPCTDPGEDQTPGADTLNGGPGDDQLNGGPPGSLQPDKLFGGDGTDTVFYDQRVAPLTITLDDVANDGEAGEGDAVATDVENVVGGHAGDVLAGSAAPNALDGRDGNDVLSGAGADDMLTGANGNDKLDGGAGADGLHGGPGDDALDGGPGPDQINGDGGRDTLTYAARGQPVLVRLDGRADDGEAGEHDNIASDVEVVLGGTVSDTLEGDSLPNVFQGGLGEDFVRGNGGVDVLDAGGGSDLVWARDGTRDTVDCGGGGDLVVMDRNDDVRNCRWFDRTGSRAPTVARSALVSGRSFGYRMPVGRREYDLDGSLRFPSGSRIDATEAKVRVTTATTTKGGREEMSVTGGPFTVGLGRSATTYRFARGPQRCSRARPRAPTDARAPRIVMRIDKGKRRPRRGRARQRAAVRGRHSIGAAFGTRWITEERCGGTYTRVLSGVVRVRDFRLGRTFVLHKGQSHLARAR